MSGRPPPPMPAWIRRMVPFRRYVLDVGGGHAMHVMETGRGRPVLCVHGNPTWGFLYRRVADALRGEPFRLIMPDLIGLGFSDKPRDPAAHTLEHHAAWLAAAIAQLDLRDYVLVVQDWGGAIGGLAAAAHADRRCGLVVLNTVLSPPRPGFRATAFHRFSQMPVVSTLAFRGLGFPQNAMRFAQGDRASITGEVAAAYRWPLRRLRDRVAPLALARMVPDSMEHPSIAPLRRCQAWAEGLDGPTAIVWGDRDPVLGRVIGWMQKMLPGASVTRTPAGHFLQEEVPAEIAAAIRKVAGEAFAG